MRDAVVLASELAVVDGLLRAEIDPGQAIEIKAGDLWRYSQRGMRRVVRLDIESAIRRNPRVRQRYCAMLAAHADAASDVAIAASDADHMTRVVGPLKLSIVRDGGDAFLLVSVADPSAAIPESIEFVGASGVARIDLQHMVRGHFQLRLVPTDPALSEIAALMQDPNTQVFLL